MFRGGFFSQKLTFLLSCLVCLSGFDAGAEDASRASVPIKARVDTEYVPTLLSMNFELERRSQDLQALMASAAGALDPFDESLRTLLEAMQSNKADEVVGMTVFPSNAKIYDKDEFLSSWKGLLFPGAQQEVVILGRIPTGDGMTYLIGDKKQPGQFLFIEFLLRPVDGELRRVWSPIVQNPLLQLLQTTLNAENLETALSSHAKTEGSEIANILAANGFPPELLVQGALLAPDAEKYKSITEFIGGLNPSNLGNVFTPYSQQKWNAYIPTLTEEQRQQFETRFLAPRKTILAIVNADPCYFVAYAPASLTKKPKNIRFDTLVQRNGEWKLSNFEIESNMQALMSEISKPLLK